MVADAYFSKYGFVSKLSDVGFEVVSRLRDDAALQYKFDGEPSGGKGRPRKFDGKVDFKNPNPTHFKTIEQNSKNKVYQATVYSKSLKSDMNLVMVYTNKKGNWSHKLYFTTDLSLSAQLLLTYYKTRFQIEFSFRDAKQETGLDHCQARSSNKLYFHWNTSLTCTKLAKITHWFSIPKQQRVAFSMADVKTIYHNELLLNRFFSTFGINPNLTKNKDNIQKLIYYGTKAS